MSHSRKIVRVFSALPIPEPIRVLFDKQRNQNLKFDVHMSKSYCLPPGDGEEGLKDCQAALITPFVKINKEVLDGNGKNLKVFYSIRFVKLQFN